MAGDISREYPYRLRLIGPTKAGFRSWRCKVADFFGVVVASFEGHTQRQAKEAAVAKMRELTELEKERRKKWVETMRRPSWHEQHVAQSLAKGVIKQRHKYEGN